MSRKFYRVKNKDTYVPGNLAAIKQALRFNPKLLNRINKLGQTALFLAASYGYDQVVIYLLQQRGVDVNWQATVDLPASTLRHCSALHAAILHGHSAAALALIAAGAKPGRLSKLYYSDTVLHSAAALGLLAVVQALLENHPSLLEEVNDLGKTAYAVAREHNCTATAEFLLDRHSRFESASAGAGAGAPAAVMARGGC